MLLSLLLLCIINSLLAYTKVIVPSVFKEWDNGQPEWTSAEMQKKHNYTVFLYQKTDPQKPNYISTNRGTEAGVYLRYIVDHYHDFPDVAVFVHAEPEVHSPNWLSMINCVRSNATYFNINRETFCRTFLQWGEAGAYVEQCWRDLLRVAWDIGNDKASKSKFELLAPTTGALKACGTCCQQFVMGRSMVLFRPLEVWQKLLQMIGVDNVCHKGELDATLHAYLPLNKKHFEREGAAKIPDNEYGRLIQGGSMEHLAHVIYGNETLVMKPPSMHAICAQFERASVCPGSPCQHHNHNTTNSRV